MNTTVALYNETADSLLMQADALGAYIAARDRRILVTGSGKAIEAYAQNDLVRVGAAVVLGIMRDIGIARAPDAYDGARFVDVLRMHFPKATMEDIKAAFELFAMGDLDNWLPTDGKGKPLDHYQQFSARFYVRVVRAYLARQADTKRNVSGKVALLIDQQAAAAKDPRTDRAAFVLVLKDIALQLAEYKAPTYVMTLQAEFVLRRLKILPEDVTVTSEDRTRAQGLMTKNKSAAVGLAIRNVLKSGAVHEDLENRAMNVCVRRTFAAACRTIGTEELTRRFDNFVEATRTATP